MGNLSTPIDVLLQDINRSYRDYDYGQAVMPHSRPDTNASYSRPAQSLASGQSPALSYEQQSAATGIPMQVLTDDYCNLQDDSNLDDFGECFNCNIRSPITTCSADQGLLAEPAAQSFWQSSNNIDRAPAGRLSLPGHTEPCRSINTYKPHKHQGKERVYPSPRDFRSRLVPYVHTPPRQMDVSSPVDAPPSSPSLRVNQRKLSRINHSTTNLSTTTSSTPRLLAPHQAKRQQQQSKGKGREGNEELLGAQQSVKPSLELHHAPPMVQGIQLVSSNRLPDRLRSVFHHPLFNAIQSKCFPTAYESNDNLVVSAPTGSGKTAILEMAICRLVSGYETGQYKVVYMAPTKSLCAERQRDWQSKFAVLDLQSAELTGDTDHVQLRSVQTASIIITTPEKWDSMTRKWKDHARLMQMVKLFLIDEVHILKDTRGATLEAVVSRMKSVGSDVRFVALSATVPNSEDIAKWLGKDPLNQHLPALRERFGEDFRPVRLQKHVIGLPYRGNDFGFESFCDPKLPDIIARYSHKKPIMIFCISRKSTSDTAKLLASIWASKRPQDRYWEGPTRRIAVQDPELRHTLTAGCAFHHAGLEGSDRYAIEKGFLEGQVNVICCTSTLAVGVNLPCHMVIIKNTVAWSDEGVKEYADLEIMQMLGRAGRPQFDTSAVAVIITKQEKQTKYERLVSGEELLESCLHLNLIDHLNAEIGLGSVYDLYTAKRWLGGTFLYVRLSQNPSYYKLDGDAVDLDLDDRIERVCQRDLALLKDSNLITFIDERLRATELGDAMARYYVQFETMQLLLRLESRAKMSDMLSALVQAKEFHEIRLKSNEKKLYKTINGANGIKYPIKVDLAMHAHKRSLILQAELGRVEFPTDEQYSKHKRQFNLDKALLFSHIHRLIRCMIDCPIYMQDAVATRHALELARCLSARVWENSPYQMGQIPQIGLVAIRKLTIGGINSIEALEASEPNRIEMLMSKHPPFGRKILDELKDFPKLRVSVKLIDKQVIKGRPIIIKIKAECGFINDKVPTHFRKKPLYICLLTERSDGHLVDFKRTSAKNLSNGKDFLMSAELFSHTQYITCSVMCDAVAGTLRYAELKPELPAHLFPSMENQRRGPALTEADTKGVQRKKGEESPHTSPATLEDDEFGESDFEDQDMVAAVEGMDFRHIDNVPARPQVQQNASNLPDRGDANAGDNIIWNPERLDNGKWACKHKCKDKSACKHMCCREGVDKPPKPPKSAFVSATSLIDASMFPRLNTDVTSKAKGKAIPARTVSGHQPAKVETLDLVGGPNPGESRKSPSKEIRSLQRLHENLVRGPTTPIMTGGKPSYNPSYIDQHQPPLPVRKATTVESSEGPSTDYGSDFLGSLPSPSVLLHPGSTTDEQVPLHSSNEGNVEHTYQSSPCLPPQRIPAANDGCDLEPLKDVDRSRYSQDEEDFDLETAMVGLSDSIDMTRDVHTQSQSICSVPAEVKQDGSRMEGIHALGRKNPSATKDCDLSSKLFLSTDSPEKPEAVPSKRRQSKSLEAREILFSPPSPKRKRVHSPPGLAVRPLEDAGGRATAPGPTIKSGQPEWVYDFDPAFIAEWQDIVEFI